MQLPRVSLIAAKAAALQDSPAGFWRSSTQTITNKAALVKNVNAPMSKLEDRHALKDKGISAKDEAKIFAMKDFILKQAHAVRA
jgi:phosphoinositide-3-kinase regulatory subunit 4